MLNAEEGQQWVLVLPPWGNIYHWKSEIQQRQLPWSKFFDLASLRRHIPVMELVDWMKGMPVVQSQIVTHFGIYKTVEINFLKTGVV